MWIWVCCWDLLLEMVVFVCVVCVVCDCFIVFIDKVYFFLFGILVLKYMVLVFILVWILMFFWSIVWFLLVVYNVVCIVVCLMIIFLMVKEIFMVDLVLIGINLLVWDGRKNLVDVVVGLGLKLIWLGLKGNIL